MRFVAIAIMLLLCSSANAGSLITRDNYKSSADSPFDLPGGGFYLEDFDDGKVNSPGLEGAVSPTVMDFRIISSAQGGVSIDIDGKSIEPTVVFDGLTGDNFTWLSFILDPVALGGLPTQFGFVLTDSNLVVDDIYLEVLGPQSQILDVFTTEYAASKFVGVSAIEGISSVLVQMKAPVPLSPRFQIDHVQYGAVPEPNTIVLLSLGAFAMGIAGKKALAGGARF